ncbi:DNA-binding response regulator [Lysinibacillus alkalisoli]|uniref:DNA-binding response regulator n=1 Tax=Lysinibacillus alkalisoli TaxID=1911548 RepID=A0A917D5D8_9BACI|nr:response regulator transcription factor [Lysinibacillus alkalisoli]GGG11286.1 DNA-binding response regulator [Lysinibacillus alkalisoli]
MYKISIIEDDTTLASLMSQHLTKYNYDVQVVTAFQDIEEAVTQYQPHLILLDINLPYFDGFYWCRKLRQTLTCPIIITSARAADAEQIMGIESGADDYIVKPFSLDVLVAKISGHLRRIYGDYAAQQERSVRYEGLILYLERLILQYDNQAVALMQKESALAQVLLSEAPKVVTRVTLLTKLWDDESFVEENTLNVNIARLRKRLKELQAPYHIEAVRGVGYKLKELV